MFAAGSQLVARAWSALRLNRLWAITRSTEGEVQQEC